MHGKNVKSEKGISMIALVITISDSPGITGNAAAGLKTAVGSAGSITIYGGTISGYGAGIEISSNTWFLFTGGTATSSYGNGINFTDRTMETRIDGATIRGANAGVHIGSGANMCLSFSGTQVYGNNYGIEDAAGARMWATEGSYIQSNNIGVYGHEVGNVLANGKYYYEELFQLQKSSRIESTNTAIYITKGPCNVTIDAGTTVTSQNGYGIHFDNGVITPNGDSRINLYGNVSGGAGQMVYPNGVLISRN